MSRDRVVAGQPFVWTLARHWARPSDPSIYGGFRLHE